MKVTSFRKKSPPGRHGEATWGGLVRIGKDFGLPMGLPFLHFCSKNEGPERKIKKSIFSIHGGGQGRARNVSFRNVFRTGLEDWLTRQCVGIDWRGVSTCLRPPRHRALRRPADQQTCRVADVTSQTPGHSKFCTVPLMFSPKIL